MRLRALVASLGALTLFAIIYHTGLLQFDGGYMALFAVALLSFAGILGNRAIVARIASTRDLKRRVLVIGPSATAQAVRHIELRDPLPGFTCVDVLVTESDLSGLDPQDITARLTRWNVDQIVVSSDRCDAETTSMLLSYRLRGIEVSTLAAFTERETKRVDVYNAEAARLLFQDRRGLPSRILKWALDIPASLLLLRVTLPVMLAAAVAIVLSDGGPVLYRQERTGLGGRSFWLLKFRSMRVDAEEDGVARWAEVGDRRVTPVGAFLRLSRIDELPQLVNVLRGEMSLVGPRPERPAIVGQLAAHIPLYQARHLVPPGITGWAQISFPYGASLDDARHKTAYDLYYVKHGNVMLDVWILIQTIRVVLMAEGSR